MCNQQDNGTEDGRRGKRREPPVMTVEVMKFYLGDRRAAGVRMPRDHRTMVIIFGRSQNRCGAQPQGANGGAGTGGPFLRLRPGRVLSCSSHCRRRTVCLRSNPSVVLSESKVTRDEAERLRRVRRRGDERRRVFPKGFRQTRGGFKQGQAKPGQALLFQ